MYHRLHVTMLAAGLSALSCAVFAQTPQALDTARRAPAPPDAGTPVTAISRSFDAKAVLAADVADAESSALKQAPNAKENASANGKLTFTDMHGRELKPLCTATASTLNPQPSTLNSPSTHKAGKITTGYYIGKDFVHDGDEVNCVMDFVRDTDNPSMVHIHNFYGLEETVDMVIDSVAGTVSILPQRIWQSTSYGDVYMFSIEFTPDGIQYFTQAPITGTIDDKGVVRLSQWGAIVGDGANKGMLLAAIDRGEYHPANAHMTATQRKSDVDVQLRYPLLLEQPSPSELTIYNMATNGVPIRARVAADGSISISQQFVISMMLYGDFNTFPINPLTGVIDKTNPIEGRIAGDSIVINPWCAGSVMQDGLVALYLTQSTAHSYVPLQLPASRPFNLTGSGTAASPYLVKTADDLLTLSQAAATYSFPDKHFRLENDIDMSGVRGFSPIGTSKSAFSGTFDGNNHKISNLAIEGLGYNFQGLFGAIYTGGAIRNLTLENASMSGTGFYLGALAGYSMGTIENCHATGTRMLTNGVNVGGLIGRSYGPLSNLSVGGQVSGIGYTGGVVGYSYGPITACTSDADVSMPVIFNEAVACVGGIAGLAQSYSTSHEGILTRLNFSGTVTQGAGYGFAGGLCGYLYAASLKESFNTGLVRATSINGNQEATGGLCGIARDSEITDCHNAGSSLEEGYSTYTGGLIGYISTTYNSIEGMTETLHVNRCYNAGYVWCRNRTTHAGVFGDEFTSTMTPEKPSDTAFTNAYTDNQATGLLDDVYGRATTFFTGATLPAGFTSTAWTASAGRYPVLKAFADSRQAALASAVVQFADGESSRVMKHAATLSAPQGVNWYLVGTDGSLGTASDGLTISGTQVQLGSVYANDTLVAAIPGVPSGRRILINVVPKLFDGEGTASSPYLIKSKADFQTLHTAVMHYDHRGDHFLQTSDVDFGLSADFAGVAAGNHLRQFAGVFDGGNHRIRRLRIHSAVLDDNGKTLSGTYNYGGLFHIGAKESVLRNIVIDADCDFDFYGNAAPVVGYTLGRVENCRNYASVKNAYSRSGGIAGSTEEGAVVTGCYNAGDISAAKADYIGGITGYNLGLVTDCQNDGTVVAVGKYVGGIAGASGGSVAFSANTADVSGSDYTGGIVGSSAAGYGQGNVYGCVSSGFVTSPGTYIGGLVGFSNGRGPRMEHNYFDASVNIMDGCSSLSQGFNALSTSEMLTATTPEGLDDKYAFSATAYPALKTFANEAAGMARRSIFVKFGKGEKRTNVIRATPVSTSTGISWDLNVKDNFRIADGQLTIRMPDNDVVADTLTATMPDGYTKVFCLKSIPAILPGSGSAEAPFVIASAQDITKLAQFMEHSGMDYEGYTFRVANDIAYPDTMTLSPVARTGVQFQGTFDGAGHTISAIRFTDETTKTGKNIGMFGTVGSKGTVRNLTLQGAITGYSYVGGFAGLLYGRIENCVSRVAVNGKSGYLGGFAGHMFDGSAVVNCQFADTIAAAYLTNYNYLGGVAGLQDLGSLVENCVNRGKIGSNKNTTGTTYTGQQYVGGIVGWGLGDIRSCRNEGTVTGRTYVGGISGRLGKAGNIHDCVNLADITVPGQYVGGITPQAQGSGNASILRCHNEGDITGKGYTAGIIGAVVNGCTIDSCYNVGTIIGQGTGTSYAVGGVIGQMQSNVNYPSSVSHSYNTGSVVNGAQSTGGFAGKITGGTVTFCHNTGDVTAERPTADNSSNGVGGFIGSFCATASDVWNSGNVVSNIPGAGGIIGTGAMPIAHLSRAANFGNVTITRSIPAKGYGAGGIWGGYGPAVIEDCINFGTVKAPDDAAGINPAMHSNGNGGTTIRRCYNAGLVQVDDTACRYSNVALISHYVDTRNPIDPALMHVDSAYFASDVCPAIAGDTLATPLTRAELMTAPLGEGFLYREYCLPTLHSLDSLAVANVHTACLAFPFGGSADNVTERFRFGTPAHVVWTASDNLAIYGEGKVRALGTGKGWLRVATDDPASPLYKQYEVNVTTVSGVDTIDSTREVQSVEYYSLDGLRLTAPTVGRPCIERVRYTDGTVATRKVLVTVAP